jgi:glycosyltransferase involved in cell wall biosynthesis
MLRAQSAGAVVTALPAANVAVPLAVSAGRLNSRVITTHHTPARTYSRGLDRADSLTGCLPCVRHIVTVSDGVAQSLAAKSAAYRTKLSTSRNAVPPDVERLLASLSADRRTRASRGKVLICSGRLAMQKNYPVVLRALARLPADVSLEIVGGGSDEQALRQLAAELAITDRVRFLGQMSRFDTLQRVSRADVFLQMSLFEGNSLSLIEAAKLGLPLIVSDVPEQREAITDPSGDLCGEAIGPHDHEGLAATVDRLLSDPNQLEQLERKSLALGDTIQFEKVVSAYERLLLPAG